MKNIIVLIFALMMLTLAGCQAIGDIFSAGFYTGLALVVGVLILIVWLISRRRG
jgi:hypothetical protein